MAWYDQVEYRDQLVRDWRDILCALLCWSEERADKWARYCWHRQGDSPYLLHEKAAWYVTPLLVPPPLRQVGAEVVVPLKVRIEGAIESSRDSLPPYACDFALARGRVQAVLAGHGCALPESEERADREGWEER